MSASTAKLLRAAVSVEVDTFYAKYASYKLPKSYRVGHEIADLVRLVRRIVQPPTGVQMRPGHAPTDLEIEDAIKAELAERAAAAFARQA